MPINYDPPWEKTAPADKPDRLHKELHTFIDFYNDEVRKRNLAQNEMAERIDAVEKAMKSIPARPRSDLALDRALENVTARSFAVREVAALLLATEASGREDGQAHLAEVADTLQTRLNELPQGISALKEIVRAEADWIVGAAQTWLRLGGR